MSPWDATISAAYWQFWWECWQMYTPYNVHSSQDIAHFHHIKSSLMLLPSYSPALPAPGNHWSDDFFHHRLVLLILEFRISGITQCIFLYSCFINIIAWVSNVFLLFWGKMSLCEHTTNCFSTPLLMEIWVISSFKLLWVKLLWTFVYTSFCVYIFSFFFFDKWLGVELLGQIWSVCSREIAWVLSKVAIPSYTLIGNTWDFHMLYILALLGHYYF